MSSFVLLSLLCMLIACRSKPSTKQDAPATTGGTKGMPSQLDELTPATAISQPADQEPGEDQAPGFVAQIMFQIDQILGEDEMKQLSSQQSQELEKQTGATLVTAEHLLRFPPRPAIGYWLEVSDRRYMVDTDGVINIPHLPAVTSEFALFAQLGDEEPYAVLPSVEFVPADQPLKPTVFKLIQKLPVSMNPNSESASLRHEIFANQLSDATLTEFAPPHFLHGGACFKEASFASPVAAIYDSIPDRCRKRKACGAGNKSPCCLDYDGPKGDGRPINRGNGPDCMAIGLVFFADSTCGIWTYKKLACANESALPWNNLNPLRPAPSCWYNHKYRNCQNLDENDFHLTPTSAFIHFGEGTDLVLRNNTAGNSSCLAISGDVPRPFLQLQSNGTLLHWPKCGGYRADHYGDNSQQHYEDMKVRLTALPPPSSDTCKATYKVVASSGGKTAKSTIVATNPNCGGWSGQISCTSQPPPGQRHEELVDSSHSEFQRLTVNVQDSAGIATGHAETHSSKVIRRKQIRGSAVTISVDITGKSDGVADGTSPATVDVFLEEAKGTYSISFNIASPIEGKVHTVDCIRGDCFESDAGIGVAGVCPSTALHGKLSDPSRLQGSTTFTPEFGGPTQTATWSLVRRSRAH